jgi:hypothetical protein
MYYEAILKPSIVKAESCVMIHRRDTIGVHDLYGQSSRDLLYARWRNIDSFFDFFFSQFVLYFRSNATDSIRTLKKSGGED